MARGLTGRHRVREESGGYCLEATVIDQVTPQLRVAREEVSALSLLCRSGADPSVVDTSPVSRPPRARSSAVRGRAPIGRGGRCSRGRPFEEPTAEEHQRIPARVRRERHDPAHEHAVGSAGRRCHEQALERRHGAGQERCAYGTALVAEAGELVRVLGGEQVSQRHLVGGEQVHGEGPGSAIADHVFDDSARQTSTCGGSTVSEANALTVAPNR